MPFPLSSNHHQDSLARRGFVCVAWGLGEGTQGRGESILARAGL